MQAIIFAAIALHTRQLKRKKAAKYTHAFAKYSRENEGMIKKNVCLNLRDCCIIVILSSLSNKPQVNAVTLKK